MINVSHEIFCINVKITTGKNSFIKAVLSFPYSYETRKTLKKVFAVGIGLLVFING